MNNCLTHREFFRIASPAIAGAPPACRRRLLDATSEVQAAHFPERITWEPGLRTDFASLLSDGTVAAADPETFAALRSSRPVRR